MRRLIIGVLAAGISIAAIVLWWSEEEARPHALTTDASNATPDGTTSDTRPFSPILSRPLDPSEDPSPPEAITDTRAPAAAARGVVEVQDSFADPATRPAPYPNVLIVRVQHAESPDHLKKLRVRVDHSAWTKERHSWNTYEDYRHTRTQTHFDVVPFEDVIVNNLRERDDIALGVEDRYGTTLLTRFLKLTEETTLVELIVTAKPRTLHGIVVDQDGNPVEGAQVSVVDAPPTSNPRPSDRTGAFEMRDVYRSDLKVSVEAKGLATTTVPWHGNAMTIQLEGGRTVAVRLTSRCQDTWGGTARLEISPVDIRVVKFDGISGFTFASVPHRAGTLTVYGPKTSTNVQLGPHQTVIDVVKPE